MKIHVCTVSRQGNTPACLVVALDRETIGMIRALSEYSVLLGHKTIKLQLPAECLARWYDTLNPEDEAPFDYDGVIASDGRCSGAETALHKPCPATDVVIAGDEVYFRGTATDSAGNSVIFDTETVFCLPGKAVVKENTDLKLAA